MRYINGQPYATVGEVAQTAGVSPQTVRLWEKLGRVSSQRTPGGHRLYDADAVRAVTDYAAQSRREERGGQAAKSATTDTRAIEFGSTGARIRAARRQRQLTQQQVAKRASISRSLLAAVERGECGMSVSVFNRIADALEIPVNDLTPVAPDESVMRAADRPTTVMAGGVRWEEMAAPGHSMAPALLVIPPGATSDGFMTLSREHFVTVVNGVVDFHLGVPPEEYTLCEGDSILLGAGHPHSWANHGTVEARAIWVEQLIG